MIPFLSLITLFIGTTIGLHHKCESVICPKLSCTSQVKKIGDCCPFCGTTSSPTKKTLVEHHDVIVIGLGFAGGELATLLSKDKKDFIALEARHTFGGRAQRIQLSENLFVPKGPAWEHGRWGGQPLTKRLKECKIRTFAQDRLDFIGFDNLGRQVPVAEMAPHLARYLKANSCCYDLADNLRTNHKPDLDVQTALEYCGWEVKDIIDRAVQYINELQFRANNDELSLKWTFLDDNITGGDFLIADPRGSEELVGCWLDRFLIGGRNSTKLKFNSTVVHTNMDTKVITLKDGTKYSYGTVFDTRSIAVQSWNWVQEKGSFFTPKLGEKRMKAFLINHYGAFDKVYLVFPKKFWGDQQYIVTGPTAATDSFIWHNYDRPGIYPGSKTLCYFVVGNNGDYMEFMTDQQVVDMLMKDLRNAYGQDAPDPIKVHVSRWDTNPLFRGTYGVLGTSFNREVFDEMFTLAGYDKSMIFTGEAYCLYDSASMEGAFEGATVSYNEWKQRNGELDDGVDPRENSICFTR